MSTEDLFSLLNKLSALVSSRPEPKQTVTCFCKISITYEFGYEPSLTKFKRTHHLSKRQRNNELSTDAHARRISGNTPHNAVPSPPAALYLSMSTGGSSQVSNTSTNGGHCNGQHIVQFDEKKFIIQPLSMS